MSDPVVGNIIEVPLTIKSTTGNLIDPTGLNVRVLAPDGTEETYNYEDLDHLTRTSQGLYLLAWKADQSGWWFWYPETSGNGEAEGDGFIHIREAYSPANIGSPLMMVRLEISDQQGELFQDYEISAILARNNDDPLLAAADLCEILARRFALQIDFEWQGQSFKQAGRAKAYADLAATLRARATQSANGGIGTIEIHRAHHRHHGVPQFDCDFDTTLIRERDC